MQNAAKSNVKASARETIDLLPEDSTWDDVIYRMYVRQKIEAGLADAENGNLLTTAEVRSQLEAMGFTARTGSRSELVQHIATDIAKLRLFLALVASAKTRDTAPSAGFGRRSRSTSPNDQSSMSCPPRHHSSVQLKAIAPHAPSSKAARNWTTAK